MVDKPSDAARTPTLLSETEAHIQKKAPELEPSKAPVKTAPLDLPKDTSALKDILKPDVFAVKPKISLEDFEQKGTASRLSEMGTWEKMNEVGKNLAAVAAPALLLGFALSGPIGWAAGAVIGAVAGSAYVGFRNWRENTTHRNIHWQLDFAPHSEKEPDKRQEAVTYMASQLSTSRDDYTELIDLANGFPTLLKTGNVDAQIDVMKRLETATGLKVDLHKLGRNYESPEPASTPSPESAAAKGANAISVGTTPPDAPMPTLAESILTKLNKNQELGSEEKRKLHDELIALSKVNNAYSKETLSAEQVKNLQTSIQNERTILENLKNKPALLGSLESQDDQQDDQQGIENQRLQNINRRIQTLNQMLEQVSRK
ncbi:MAG: hypothetical protein JKY15_07890 [Deltaproteobacteria bacterium]|nr:hypothetical protein [Deltaproteobacteria bacterium]